MPINGIMIDCSRLMERHEFYFELVEFMSEWEMNTLLLHFSDDHGLGIELEGFESLAMDRALARDEVRALIGHAAERGIEVIPELETFGHTRYITDHPDYEDHSAGPRMRELVFNALDPVRSETDDLIRRLLEATAALFPAGFLHIGCDEVDLANYCRERGLDESQTWVNYVNRVIGMVHDLDRTPMMWADHVTGSPAVAEHLRRDVVLVDWRYYTGIAEADIAGLADSGFMDVIGAPSLGCSLYRFFPTAPGLSNTLEIIRLGSEHGYGGNITTIWCPHRYFQKSIYYGIALSATAVRTGPGFDLEQFQRRFAQRVFGTDLVDPLATFLNEHAAASVSESLALALVSGSELAAETVDECVRINEAATVALTAAGAYQPGRNHEVFAAMVLGVEAAWLCSESVILRTSKGERERVDRYMTRLGEIRSAAGLDWDTTRFPDSTRKREPQFPGQEGEYALLILDSLPGSIDLE